MDSAVWVPAFAGTTARGTALPLARYPRDTCTDHRASRHVGRYDYFREHAIAAARKARALPPGRPKQKQRTVARVYHLLSKEAALAPNIHHLNDFRAARRLERQIGR